MIDGIKLVAKIADHEHYVTTVSSHTGIEFEGHINATTAEILPPVRNTSTTFGGSQAPSLQTSTYRNYNTKTLLKVKGNTVIFQGSLQKAYKGNNYSGFTRTEVQKACEKVSNDLLLPETDLKVKNFEISVTVENAPLYPVFHSFKNRYVFKEMAKNNVVFGKDVYLGKANKGDYGIKFYDKTKQVELEEKIKLEKQLQQFELKVVNPRWFNADNKFPVHSLNDLHNENALRNMADEVMKAYYLMAADESFMNYDRLSRTLSATELSMVASLSNPKVAPYLKQALSEASYKKYAKVYQQVLKDTRSFHCFEEIDDFGYKLSDAMTRQIRS